MSSSSPSSPASPAVDFAALAEAAYPESGVGDRAALDALWRATLDLPEWFFLVHPDRVKRGEDPFPFIAEVGDTGWIFAFTSENGAGAFAHEHELLGPNDQVYCVRIVTRDARILIQRMAQYSVSQVHFDEGEGWSVPVGELEDIAERLGRGLGNAVRPGRGVPE